MSLYVLLRVLSDKYGGDLHLFSLCRSRRISPKTYRALQGLKESERGVIYFIGAEQDLASNF